MSTRRGALAALASALAAWPLASRGQTLRRVPHIGILSWYRQTEEDLTRALQQVGYVDGRSAIIDWHWSAGKGQELAEIAAVLVKAEVDVIVALGSEATLAAKEATTTIPIVFSARDPVAAGFVQSLARPGANLTGISNQRSDLASKLLQLLRDLLPDASEVAVIWSPTNASTAVFLHDAEAVSAQYRFKINPVAIANAEDLEPGLAEVGRARPRAIIVTLQPITVAYDTRIGAFALNNRIVTLAGTRRMVERGQLMFYGPTASEGARQIADYVDKVLKGVKPADLPIQQPTKLELVINLKTAKALGLTIPQSLLLRADEVID
jgi:putative ABC transport system substrate-binding protein